MNTPSKESERRMEMKRGQLMFLNFKLTHNQSPKNYVALFDELYKQDPIVNLRGEKVISLNNIFKDEIQLEDGSPRMIYGKVATYNIIDKDAFYDRKRKELISIDLGNNIVSHFKFIDFYFVPSVHRLAFFANQDISEKQIYKYFKEASEQILGEGQVNVTFETSCDVVDRIVKSKYIENYFAVISYSNRDEHKLFASLVDEKTREDNIERLEISAKPAKGEAIVPQSNGMIAATTELAKSNGYVVATIREGEDLERVKLDTTQHPRKERISTPIMEIKNTIYKMTASLFK